MSPVDAIIVNTATGTITTGQVGCDRCQMLACICNMKRRHADDCKFLRAARCPVAIECEHGYDVCPDCDPCTCAAGVAVEDFAE